MLLSKFLKLLVVTSAIACGVASVVLPRSSNDIALLTCEDADVNESNDVDLDDSTSNNTAAAACKSGGDVPFAWTNQIKQHMQTPSNTGYGMHLTSTILAARKKNPQAVRNLRVLARDADTALLKLQFTDINNKQWNKTVWSDDQNYPGGGFPVYPGHAINHVRQMCSYALLYAKCAQGASTAVVWSGFHDAHQVNITMCVRVVYDPATYPKNPGRTYYPKSVARSKLAEGTVGC